MVKQELTPWPGSLFVCRWRRKCETITRMTRRKSVTQKIAWGRRR